MNGIEVCNLCYRIDEKTYIDNVTFSVPKGGLFTLCGPSGAGKTTIFRLITGELSPESGDILINGESVKNKPMQKRDIVMVAQDNQLFPHMTIYENTAFGLESRHVPKSEIKESVEELALFFHLEGHLKHYPNELSGGQQKSATIMRAIAVKPKVLLLDEPFTGLDNNLHYEIRDYLLRLQSERGFTVLTISHSKEDAFFMGNRIGFLFDGRLRLCATISQLRTPTNDKIVNDFLGKIVFLPDGRFVFEDKILNI